jgi:hypothetical protein
MCNYEKTSIMRIGNLEEIPDPRIYELGFTFVTESKLLGFTIANDGNIKDGTLGPIMVKVKKTVNFWKRFNLSLPGKITIVKSVIMPIINYATCIITPDSNWLDKMENIFANFVIGTMNISKDRLFKEAGHGGVGLFKLSDFIIGLQIMWIKRANIAQNDNWSSKIFGITGGEPTFLTEQDQTLFGPTLTSITGSFLHFRNEYGKCDGNFKYVPVLNNKNFLIRQGERGIFDNKFFTQFFDGLDHQKI